MSLLIRFLSRMPKESRIREESVIKWCSLVPQSMRKLVRSPQWLLVGLLQTLQDVPGPYKNFSHAIIRREQTLKWGRIEAGAGEDFWEARNTRGGIIELKIQYQLALPSRAKSEQKIYSAAEPNFFRIYRVDMGTSIIKSVSAGIDRVQSYQLRVAVPELSKILDGTEQLVGIAAIPLYVRQIFLP